VGTRVRFRLPVPDAASTRHRPVAADGARPPAGPARLAVGDEPDGVRLEISGELDLASAGAVGTGVLERLAALAPGTTAVLDLRPTTYLASAGVGLVLQACGAAEARGVRFTVLTARGSAPDRLLRLAGLADLVTPRSGDVGG
jgi:anti-anti-sigma factor